MQKTTRDSLTLEGRARVNAHKAKLAREDHIKRFFTDSQQRTADAILFEAGFEITLEPKS